MIFKNVLTFSIFFKSQTDTTTPVLDWCSEELNLAFYRFPTSIIGGSRIIVDFATIGFSGFQTFGPDDTIIILGLGLVSFLDNVLGVRLLGTGFNRNSFILTEVT